MSRDAAAPPWSHIVRLDAIARVKQPLKLEADETVRERVAKALELAGLPRFSAEVRVTPWMEGIQIEARWAADVTYCCGVTLEPFPAALEGEFMVRAVPPDSPAAGRDDAELDLAPETADPPDVLERDEVDIGAYLVEHLALELDPFPRKPGAVFEPPADSEPPSPFAVLRHLRPPGDEPKG